MADGLVEGFVPELGGSDHDLLAQLAAQLGSQDDIDTQQEPAAVENEDVEMETGADEEQRPPATESAPIPTMSSIEEAYKVSCASKRIQALQSHLDLLKNIPVSLTKQVDIKSAPSGVVGGAVINAAAATTALDEENDPPSIEHTAALLDALVIPDTAGKLLLLDHLELSGLPLPSSILSAVIHQAGALGPWWRLRSLALSGCNIDITHLQQILTPEAQSFLWHLQRLDFSCNPCLGRDVADGALRPLSQFTAPATLMMMRLWRGAPLKYLDISYTELTSSVLAVCLRTLRSYPLPCAVGGCGSPLHDGTRPNLECLKLGPPGDGVWSGGLLAEISALMESAPQLIVLELCGATTKERDVLGTAWQQAQEKRNNMSIQIAEVRPGVVRFAAGSATQQLLPIEHTPQRHSLPGSAPDSRAAGNGNTSTDALGDLPHLLDDWNTVFGTDCGTADDLPKRMVQDVLRPSVPANRGAGGGGGGGGGALLPPRRPHTSDGADRSGRGGGGGGGGGGSRPRGDGAPRRQRGGGGSRPRGAGGNRDRLPSHQTTAADYGMTSHDWDANEDNPVRQPRGTSATNPRKKSRASGTSGPRPVRIYRGGNAEDELPAGGIDINSDDDGRHMNDSEEDSYYSDEKGYDDMMDIDNGPGGGYYDEEEEEEDEEEGDDGSQRQNAAVPAATATAAGNPSSLNVAAQPIEQRFKIRDGEMDVDSKLGRIYRADAKAFYKSIPDKADQKAAKAAFNLWDSCAENAWDRHRWDRPSKTQFDEPHVLGQLNKLFDLAKKYKKDLGFPFPKWVPGGGTAAFDVVKKTTVTVSRPPPVVQVQQQQQEKSKITKTKPNSVSDAQERKKTGSHLPKRNRMVDDGGRGRESDKEESDGGGGDDFMVPDGPMSDPESDSEKEVEIIDLVGSGRKSGGGAGGGGNNNSKIQKTPNPFILPESQSPVHPSGTGTAHTGIGTSSRHHHHQNRALIADSDDDDDFEDGNNNKATGSGSGGGGRKDSSAAAREIARLSAWNWDSRKEEHPPNEAVYGLADGKRSRRQRFTASQIVEVLGSEEQQQLEQEQELVRKQQQRRRREEREEEELDELHPAITYDSSSSDDDVPLAAQFSRFRTPGSNEPGSALAAIGDGRETMTASPSEAADDPLPMLVGAKSSAGISLEHDAITPDASGSPLEVLANASEATAPPHAQQQHQQPAQQMPNDPSKSAERAAALARALLGSLYKPNDVATEQQEDFEIMPSLPAITREDEHVAVVTAPPEEEVPLPAEGATALASSPIPVSTVGARIGIVPDSQEDEDIF